MIDSALHKALTDGVLCGVQQAAANLFKVYREQRSDLQQKERTEDGLIDIMLAAEEMLKLIEELKPDA
jgi:hypothetical protein